MALIFHDFGQSKETIEFCGSSEEDRNYAKTFWQSVQLLPPMESRLVSSDIRQRLKHTTPGSQPVNVASISKNDSSELTTFLANVRETEKQEKMERLKKYSELRSSDLALLSKHKQERLEKEKHSHSAAVRRTDTMGIPVDSYHEQEVDDTALETKRELENFEKEKGLYQNDSDSD